MRVKEPVEKNDLQLFEMLQFDAMRDALKGFGIYELVIAKVENRRELLKMYRDDFQSLMQRCMEGI